MNMGLREVVVVSYSRNIEVWCNGSTKAFDTFGIGPNPVTSAK